MKSKAFLITSVVFGSLGMIILLVTVISFFNNDDSITSAIADFLNMKRNEIKNEVLAQVSIVFFIPAFIFAFRTFVDNDTKHDE